MKAVFQSVTFYVGIAVIGFLSQAQAAPFWSAPFREASCSLRLAPILKAAASSESPIVPLNDLQGLIPSQNRAETAVRNGNFAFQGSSSQMPSDLQARLYQRLTAIKDLLFASKSNVETIPLLFRGPNVPEALAEFENSDMSPSASYVFKALRKMVANPNPDQILVSSSHEIIPESIWKTLTASGETSDAESLSAVAYLRFLWGRFRQNLQPGSYRDVYIDHFAYYDRQDKELVWLFMIRGYSQSPEIPKGSGGSGRGSKKSLLEGLEDLSLDRAELVPVPIPIPVEPRRR